MLTKRDVNPFKMMDDAEYLSPIWLQLCEI